MGIDLRSVPYSFLVMDRREEARVREGANDGSSRIIGHPRMHKGYAKIFNCSSCGVSEITLQRRTDPVLFKRLERSVEARLFRWKLDQGEVLAGLELEEEAADGGEEALDERIP